MQDQKRYLKGFCIVCSNRVLSLQEGAICGLTNLTPKLDLKCDQFTIDNPEITKKTNHFESFIEHKYTHFSKKKFWSDPDTSYYIERVEVQQRLTGFTNHGVNKKFHRNKYDITTATLGFLGVLFLIMYGNIKHNYAHDLKSPAMIFLISYIIIGALYLTYNYFNDNKYVIETSEEYINLNGLKIFWNSVLDYVIIEGKYENKLIMCTSLNKIKEIDMKQFDISPFDIANIIEKQINKFHPYQKKK